MTKQNNNQRLSLEYSQFNRDIELQESRDKQNNRKKSSFLQTFAESFNFYHHIRRKANISNKKNKRKFSTSHHTIKYYHKKTAVHRFLQKPTGRFGRAYHISISCLILICIVMTILSTVQDMDIMNEILYGFDVIILGVFLLEFAIRLWASECVSHYRGLRGKLRFFMSPFRVLDMIVIITSILIVVLSVHKNHHFLMPSLQWVRFFQTFKMIRLEHSFKPWRVMGSVIWSQREHLYITTYTSFLALLLTSFVIYFIEKDFNPQFDNLGESLWWTVISLCTIGYGDVAPVTTAGKICASIFVLIGVSLFALPAGILGTGLALKVCKKPKKGLTNYLTLTKVEEQQRQRQIGRRRIPAVKLIQSSWRYHNFRKNRDVFPVWTLTQRSPKPSFSKPKAIRRKQLTENERNALNFILKTKYFVNRKQFQQTLKPYDVKDVLEQYSAGHLEMLARVKHINNKVSTIELVGQSCLRGQHESRSLVNYRLIKLEEFMSETDNKLDQLLKIQNENKILYENIISIFENNFSQSWKICETNA